MTNLARLYLLNASALITHEIDSAYWNEWRLFRLPGGIQLFLVINLVFVLLILTGYRAVLLGRASARSWSWLLVGGGFFAVIAHTIFLARGNPAFRLPVSLAVLGLVLVVSIAQAIATANAPLSSHDRTA